MTVRMPGVASRQVVFHEEFWIVHLGRDVFKVWKGEDSCVYKYLILDRYGWAPTPLQRFAVTKLVDKRRERLQWRLLTRRFVEAGMVRFSKVVRWIGRT
jgi:hypothetical protein